MSQDPFGTYAEKAQPLTIGEFFTRLGQAGRGTAGGLVRAPYVLAKGVDDIIDVASGNDPKSDAYATQGLNILNRLGNYMAGDSEQAQVAAELLGENLLLPGAVKGGVGAAKGAIEYLGPNLVTEELMRAGVDQGDADLAGIALSAAMGMGRRAGPPDTMDVTLPSGRELPEVKTQSKGEVAENTAVQRQSAAGYVANPLLSEVDSLLEKGMITKTSAKKIREQLESNPAFRGVMERREGGNRSVSTEDLSAGKASYEDLLGNVGVPIPADPTSTSRMVDRIGGVEIDPFETQGGPRHADKYGYWKSEPGAATGKVGHINRVGMQTGQNPLGIYMGMANEGSNFSTMPAQGVLAYLDAVGGMTPEAREIMVRSMRSMPNKGDKKNIASTFPDTADLDELRGYLFDRSTVKPDTPSLGDRRKAFSSVAGKAEMLQAGFPEIGDIYAAVNEPGLLYKGVNDTGYRGFVTQSADPKNLEMDDLHGTYRTIIPGQGGFAIDGEMVPSSLMFPDMFAARSSKTPAEARRSVQTSGGANNYQEFNQQWLDGIMSYLGR